MRKAGRLRSGNASFWERYAIAWGMVVVSFGSYLLIGDMGSLREQIDLMTPLDEAIAFLPWTIWLYLFVFIGVFHWGVWIVRERRHYLRMCASLLLADALAFPIFALFPASYPRPDASGPGVSLAVLRALYELDPPNNTFPSLHVAFMTLVGLGIWRYDRRQGIWVTAVAFLPALTILTTKQHFVADFLGGLVLALGCHVIVFGITSRSAS